MVHAPSYQLLMITVEGPHPLPCPTDEWGFPLQLGDYHRMKTHCTKVMMSLVTNAHSEASFVFRLKVVGSRNLHK